MGWMNADMLIEQSGDGARHGMWSRDELDELVTGRKRSRKPLTRRQRAAGFGGHKAKSRHRHIGGERS